MATAADKKRWDDLHAAQAKAQEIEDEYESELRRKYGYEGSWRSWIKKGERDKLERLEAKTDKIGDKIIELLVRVSPRGEAWLSGAPSWWIRQKLTWEDAIRPASEPLSVVVPGSYGNPDGTVRSKGNNMKTSRVRSRRQPSLPGFPDMPDKLDIRIPNMPMWEQIGGDANPGAYGGLLARSDGDALELIEIQPVREYVGDGEAKEVGFPFWTKTGYYDLNDLNPKTNSDVKKALETSGFYDGEQKTWFEEEATPEQRALVIAESLMRYGAGSEEGQGGWSDDIIHDKVKWQQGKVAGAEYLADEDDAFVREVLLDDLDIDVEKFNRDKDPTNGFHVRVSRMSVEITEWTDVEDATGEEAPEGEKILKTETEVDLEELLDPKAKHQGTMGGKHRDGATLRELAQMDEEEREDTIITSSLAYIGYYGGSEEYVDAVGD